jgi:ethanolamine utilization protein EutN
MASYFEDALPYDSNSLLKSHISNFRSTAWSLNSLSIPRIFLGLSAVPDFLFFLRLPFGTTLPRMLIGLVIGDVVATQKVPSHEGRKILVVQPLHLDGTDRGDPVLALDAVDAGFGDRVLLTTDGFSAMTAVGRPNSPIDSAVIGVIDSIHLHEE